MEFFPFYQELAAKTGWKRIKITLKNNMARSFHRINLSKTLASKYMIVRDIQGYEKDYSQYISIDRDSAKTP